MSGVDPAVRRFIELLKDSPERDDVFNPWWQSDPVNDRDGNGPEIRRAQLGRYLTERLGRARWLLLGEALGYQGGHFSGMAMTSERILLGHMRRRQITPEHVFAGLKPQRTSREDIKPNGFSENTATIVWGEIVALGLDPRAIVIWNAYPWHPFKKAAGMLTNRTPSDSEVAEGGRVLTALIELMGCREILAVGNKAATQLSKLGHDVEKARHPACGGAPAFRLQFADWIKRHGR